MKMIKVSLFALMLTIGTSGMVFAAAQTTALNGTTVVVGGSGFTTATATLTSSSNVRLVYNGAAQTYGLSGEHLNGSRAYATWSGSSSILYVGSPTKAAGSWTLADPTTTQPASGWTAQ